jgi:hypothetical protein
MYIYIQMKAKNVLPVKKVSVEILWPLLPGSLSTARIACGKPNCACRQDPEKRHGLYYRWTGFLAGKRTTKAISPEEAKVCEQMIQNYRQALETLARLVQQSIPETPWEKRSSGGDPNR